MGAVAASVARGQRRRNRRASPRRFRPGRSARAAGSQGGLTPRRAPTIVPPSGPTEQARRLLLVSVPVLRPGNPMANDDPRPTPPAPACERRIHAPARRPGPRAAAARAPRCRARRRRDAPARPRLPQRDVAEDEPAGRGRRRPRGRGARPAEEPRRSRSRLDLAVLKEMSIQKLIEVAKALEIPGAAVDEEAGAGLPDPARAGGEGRAHLLRGRARDPARRLRLPARARVLLPARARTTSTSRPRRSASSTCAPATRSAARSARPRRTSATSPSSRSTRSTSSRPTASKEKIFFDNLTPLYPQDRIRLETTPEQPHDARDGPA